MRVRPRPVSEETDGEVLDWGEEIPVLTNTVQ